ncbi:MAG: heme-binding domain-containing protein [Methanosarcina sp.]
MKAVRIIVPVLIVLFIVIQFIPAGIPENKPEDGRSLDSSKLLSGPIQQQLKRSCYDCHSGNVNFPWYAKLAPSSWLLSKHIREGKDHLNFSEWAGYSKRKQISLLGKINEEVESGDMPLRSYILIHRDAKLTPEERNALLKWTEEASDKVME